MGYEAGATPISPINDARSCRYSPKPVAVEFIGALALFIPMLIVHRFAVSGMEIVWRLLFFGSRKSQTAL
jgi:hypothetical protein